MSKKILALALAIVFIATAFTACKKGPELTEINGVETMLEELPCTEKELPIVCEFSKHTTNNAKNNTNL